MPIRFGRLFGTLEQDLTLNSYSEISFQPLIFFFHLEKNVRPIFLCKKSIFIAALCQKEQFPDLSQLFQALQPHLAKRHCKIFVSYCYFVAFLQSFHNFCAMLCRRSFLRKAGEKSRCWAFFLVMHFLFLFYNSFLHPRPFFGEFRCYFVAFITNYHSFCCKGQKKKTV